MALVAAVLLAAPRKAEAEHVAWSATLTVQDFGNGFVGCHSGSATTAHKCSTTATLSDNDFIFGGTTYTVRTVTLGNNAGTLRLTFSLASGQSWPTALLSYSLHVGGTELSLSGVVSGNLANFDNPGVSWAAGSSVSLSLENSAVTHGVDPEQARAERAEQERERERDMRKSARRGGGCGAPEDGLSPDSDEAGYWHCHGDSVYHRHAGTWRGSHQPGGDRPQPPGLRPEPRPPTQAERDRGFADNWNGGWHWHGDDIYHIHRSPH